MRGDSGMSDSQFIKFQELMRKKHEKFTSTWSKIEEEHPKEKKYKNIVISIWIIICTFYKTNLNKKYFRWRNYK